LVEKRAGAELTKEGDVGGAPVQSSTRRRTPVPGTRQIVATADKRDSRGAFRWTGGCMSKRRGKRVSVAFMPERQRERERMGASNSLWSFEHGTRGDIRTAVM
jgi:hypothetical protein